MSEVKQKTIKEEFFLSGVGLHTGNAVRLRFKPANENQGICFVRTDLPNTPQIKVCPDNILNGSSVPRCSSIGKNGVVIHTVEHLLSVLCALGVDNLIVEMDNNELPGLDGSGFLFLQAIKKVGLVEQSAPCQFIYLKEPVGVESNGSSIFITPATDLSVSYTLDYGQPNLPSQFFSSQIDIHSYEREIASCRTFCLEEEAQELRNQGLGRGANYENTLVIGKDGVQQNTLRFKDEFARHKVLDVIGDLYLLGRPIKGHVFAVKSGHSLNIALLRKILQQQNPDLSTGNDSKQNLLLPQQEVMGIKEIMKILPHRYPFLLVDRIIHLEKGKRAVGIKNVTINDGFFQGHFPTRPVMPGVLMIEALAQTAGVAILTNEEHRGKVAFFMSVDKVKFRRVVVPGDQLLLSIEVIRDRSKTAQIYAEAKVHNEVAVEAHMMFSFTDANYLNQ